MRLVQKGNYSFCKSHQLSTTRKHILIFSCINAYADSLTQTNKSVLAGIILGNIGLFFVDHIHFQYNGIMFGILLLSIAQMHKGNFLVSGFLFAILLNMKHIFMYIAPAYIVYMLKNYVLQKPINIFNVVKLGGVVIGVTTISLGPFIQQLPQVK